MSELGSHQDQNVLVDTGAGRFVLKIANAAFGEAELDLQNRAMVHLAERLPLELPRPCAALDGSEIVAVERDGVTYLLRLVTFVEGEPLIDARTSRRRCCTRWARSPARSRARSRTSSTRRPIAPCSGIPATSAPSSRRSRRTSRIRAAASSSSGVAACRRRGRSSGSCRSCRARSCTAT